MHSSGEWVAMYGDGVRLGGNSYETVKGGDRLEDWVTMSFSG